MWRSRLRIPHDNFISIGWQIGDLTKYKTKKDIEEAIMQLDPSRETRPYNDALCCFDFIKTIKNGDLVFIKEGTKKILGVGEIQGDYQFQKDWVHFGACWPEQVFA